MTTRTLPRVDPKTSTDEPDEFAHIVWKDDQMKGYALGIPIKALCGKIWVPSRDYSGLPICSVCEKERDKRLSGMKNLN